MTHAPTDIARIAALCERVWAKVPEARPTEEGFDLAFARDGEEWQYLSGIVYYSVSTQTAIALIESACLHYLGEVRIYVPGDDDHRYAVHFEWDEYGPSEVFAPTLVEALLLAVEAKGKKEDHDGTR